MPMNWRDDSVCAPTNIPDGANATVKYPDTVASRYNAIEEHTFKGFMIKQEAY